MSKRRTGERHPDLPNRVAELGLAGKNGAWAVSRRLRQWALESRFLDLYHLPWGLGQVIEPL